MQSQPRTVFQPGDTVVVRRTCEPAYVLDAYPHPYGGEARYRVMCRYGSAIVLSEREIEPAEPPAAITATGCALYLIEGGRKP